MHSVRDRKFEMLLSDTIIECFHLETAIGEKGGLGSELSKETRAFLILERVLSSISQTNFSLNTFIKIYKLSQKSVKQLLTSLLYGIYFKEIQFAKLQGFRDLECLLLQTLSEKIPRSKLKSILKLMSIDQHVHLLGFILKRYREGSYAIIRELKNLCLSCQHQHHLPMNRYKTLLLDLIIGLTQKFFDMKVFLKLEQETYIDEAILAKILDKMKTHAQKNIKTCFDMFNKLIPLIIDSPLRGYESLEKLNGQFDKYQNFAAKQIALGQQKSLQNLFQPYIDKNYFLKDFQALALIGLFGQVPYIQIGGKSFLTAGLKDKIKFLYEIFKEPSAVTRLAPSELESTISFILTFILHLEAVSRDPNILKKGIHALTCAMPTREKYLAEQTSLESLLEGFQSLIHFLQQTLKDPCSFNLETAIESFKEIPIFVYDQSNSPLFEKNKQYIKKLISYYKCSIIHLSHDQIMALAKKIGIEKLICTSDVNRMGYGGSRNCIFLLTPLLKYLFKTGKKTFSEVLKLDSRLLIDLFQQIVLRNSTKINNTIFMIDDDMEIPAANIFSHALFAQQCENEYLYSHGFCVGRVTKYLNKFRELQEILENPSGTFEFSQWLDIPFSIKMAEYVGKPKICLNLPLGQEEAHLQLEWVSNPMLQISRHLGGTRYPSGQIPSHFFVGLETHLKKNIPYVLGISLSMDLIDPSNTSNKCILPWNNRTLISNFKSLHDVFLFISDEKNMQELQKRFWRNVNDVFHTTHGLSIPLRQDIDKLRHMDVDTIIKEFKLKNYPLDRNENQSLTAIGNLYKFHQQDSQLFWEFGSELMKLKILDTSANFDPSVNIGMSIDDIITRLEKKYHILITNYPTTYNFFLMCHSLGAGEFSKWIKATISLENYALK